ncbi:rhomboid family intramembrane serine protease [Neptuniibacter caesariensis]|uniref:Rhomboid family intramembrane serine protease n=1 Tax=Neptuniibacter caesariensis TaxID=207954 RepID=A0A7U8C4A6_NEPCE|nr:rhomboid family intramembrane serine protease [Neptuniibacter caesariensis]EAR59840.1 hypothetical protein MED92_12671 [Neptuniibacter caesariensis]
MIKVITVPLREDLTEFTQFLWKYEVPHRVIETEHSQELWVAHTVSADKIYELYELWRRGQNLDEISLVSHATKVSGPDFIHTLKNAWFSALLIIASVVLTFAIGFGDNFDLLRYFTIADVLLRDGRPYTSGIEATIESMEYWRLFSPMFLHFSAPHIVFNVLWIWVVGTRIEISLGRGVLIALVLFTALVSNLAQYWEAGPLFGGLSGVVFAYLGFAWLWDRTDTHLRIGLPPAIMGFLLVWLALGYTGTLEAMGLGAIANTAHLVGMLAGFVFVPVARFMVKRRD